MKFKLIIFGYSKVINHELGTNINKYKKIAALKTKIQVLLMELYRLFTLVNYFLQICYFRKFLCYKKIRYAVKVFSHFI